MRKWCVLRLQPACAVTVLSMLRCWMTCCFGSGISERPCFPAPTKEVLQHALHIISAGVHLPSASGMHACSI